MRFFVIFLYSFSISHFTKPILGSKIIVDEKIKNYITETNPIVISVNHINTIFSANFIFISNPKRFDRYKDSKLLYKNTEKLIITSNIKDTEEKSDFILNWNNLKSSETIIGESSLYLLLKALVKLNTAHIILAGFDGFSKYTKNYYDKTQQFFQSQENISEITSAIIEQLAEFQKHSKIDFLTDSVYKKEVVKNA